MGCDNKTGTLQLNDTFNGRKVFKICSWFLKKNLTGIIVPKIPKQFGKKSHIAEKLQGDSFTLLERSALTGNMIKLVGGPSVRKLKVSK